MNRNSARAAAFGIGVVAGLRSLLAPAVLAWTARRHFRGDFPLAALISAPVSKRMIKLAAGELLADKLPFTPNRISPGPLATRIASGAACGAAVTYVVKQPPQEGALLGAAGAAAGSFAGYYARRSLRQDHSDLAVALIEDALAIALAAGIVYRVKRDL